MGEIAREHFYDRLNAAPHAAVGFFESVIEHFHKSNTVIVHHTDTNGGDLRLALPGELVGHHTLRNFATLYWQSKNKVIFSRTYLNPDELEVFGIEGAIKPKSASEPLNSDIRLYEDDWRYGVLGFIRVLEAAKIKFTA